MRVRLPVVPCPPATQNVATNLLNRSKAIRVAGYGPANPAMPNPEFWRGKAAEWGTTPATARTMRCGNCAAFNVSPRMKTCIARGAGDEGQNPWDFVDAGELGYCMAFHFKCAAARTCSAWVVGGPVRTERRG